MSNQKDNVTMKMIAEEAGVTLTTVSRILNNKGGKYADATKEKIFDIAKRLKYRPNALVLGMQTGKTGTAGVMVPAASFYYRVIEGIHEVFISKETIMLLSWNHRSRNEREEAIERQIIHQMVDRRVEGIILRPSSETFERSYFEEIWEREIPLILIDRALSKIETDFVGSDDVQAGREAAEHLISLGHRKLLFVGHGNEASTSRYREEGFRKILSESPNAYCRSITSPSLMDEVKQEIMQALNSEDPPTAIFCYNDDYARIVADIILKSGRSIPGDISLIGCGNVPTTEASIPLTTFEQHPDEVGRRAAKLYLERIAQTRKNGIRRELITPEFVDRGSTGPKS